MKHYTCRTALAFATVLPLFSAACAADDVSEDASSSEVVASQSSISGNVQLVTPGYPSEGWVPAARVVAYASDGSRTFEVRTAEQDAPAGVPYRIAVPPGTYFVAAFTEAQDLTTQAYSDFAACGFTCADTPSSHFVKPVVVHAGEAVTKINPNDESARRVPAEPAPGKSLSCSASQRAECGGFNDNTLVWCVDGLLREQVCDYQNSSDGTHTKHCGYSAAVAGKNCID